MKYNGVNVISFTDGCHLLSLCLSVSLSLCLGLGVGVGLWALRMDFDSDPTSINCRKIASIVDACVDSLEKNKVQKKNKKICCFVSTLSGLSLFRSANLLAHLPIQNFR